MEGEGIICRVGELVPVLEEWLALVGHIEEVAAWCYLQPWLTCRDRLRIDKSGSILEEIDNCLGEGEGGLLRHLNAYMICPVAEEAIQMQLLASAAAGDREGQRQQACRHAAKV